MKGYLFFDIDGTLVDSEVSDEITPSALQAIHKAQANGYGCYISSGRNLKGIEMYLKDGFDGAVFADGAGVILTDSKPELITIAPEVLNRLIETIINEFHGSICPWGLHRGFASEGIYDHFISLMKKRFPDEQAQAMLAKSWGMYQLNQMNGEEIVSCDVEFPDAQSEEAFIKTLDPALEYISTTASYGRGGICTGEVTVKGVTKAAGMKRLLERYGSDEKTTYAFGDSMNDSSIISAATIGICMGNGAEELKQMADYITDDIHHDGIEKALKQFGII